MLRTLIVVSLVALMLSSCKKDKNDTPTYHISAKLDGVKTDFNFAVAAELIGDNAQTGYKLLVVASGGNSTNLYPLFELNVDSEAPIVAKTYVTNDSQSLWEASADYIPDGPGWYETNLNNFSITIISITATQVEGVFSGTIEDYPTLMTVTEGTFTAKFE